MNYSTAKTIVQAFRREKRISRKYTVPFETKKSLKKEHCIDHFLKPRRVNLLISAILDTETKSKLSLKNTNIDTLSTNPLLEKKILNKTEEIKESGLIIRKVDFGVNVNLRVKQFKKNIFFIINPKNSEEEYNKKINYENELNFKVRKKTKKFIYDNDCTDKDCSRIIPIFNFHRYRKRIIKEHKKTMKMKQRITLPSPNLYILENSSNETSRQENIDSNKYQYKSY